MAEVEPRPAVNRETDYERSDVRLGIVALIALLFLAFLVVAPLGLRSVFPRAVMDVDRRLAIHPPPPELQSNPQEDLEKLRNREQAWLEGYGWVDRQHGVVHIPIARAMKNVVEHGIDGFPEPQR